MIRNLFSSAVMAAGAVLFASALPAEATGSPQITVSQIAIVGGKLVIAGNATSVGKVVTIQGTTVHTASAGPQKAFAFNVNYRTNDCRLTLVTDTGSLDNLIIGNCAPGFTAKGAWAIATQYALNDVVTRFGQTYRAKNTSTGKAPESNVANWELFAAKGIVGPAGLPGTPGTPGTNGTNGTNGVDGAPGTNGSGGAAGPPGPSGVVSVITLAMSIGPALPLTTTEFNFVGTTPTPLPTVNLDGQEQLTGTVGAMITSSLSSTVQFSLCYQLQPSGTVTLFTTDTYQSITSGPGEAPKPFQASATALPAAGTYKIGGCAKYSPNVVSAFPNLSRINGWVMVTRSP